MINSTRQKFLDKQYVHKILSIQAKIWQQGNKKKGKIDTLNLRALYLSTSSLALAFLFLHMDTRVKPRIRDDPSYKDCSHCRDRHSKWDGLGRTRQPSELRNTWQDNVPQPWCGFSPCRAALIAQSAFVIG